MTTHCTTRLMIPGGMQSRFCKRNAIPSRDTCQQHTPEAYKKRRQKVTELVNARMAALKLRVAHVTPDPEPLAVIMQIYPLLASGTFYIDPNRATVLFGRMRDVIEKAEATNSGLDGGTK